MRKRGKEAYFWVEGGSREAICQKLIAIFSEFFFLSLSLPFFSRRVLSNWAENFFLLLLGHEWRLFFGEDLLTSI